MERRKIRELSPMDFIALCNEFYYKYRDVGKGLCPVIDAENPPTFLYVLEPFCPPTDEGLYMFLRKATANHIISGQYHDKAVRFAAKLEDPDLLGFSPAIGRCGGRLINGYSFEAKTRPCYYWTIERSGPSYEALISILSRAM